MNNSRLVSICSHLVIVALVLMLPPVSHKVVVARPRYTDQLVFAAPVQLRPRLMLTRYAAVSPALPTAPPLASSAPSTLHTPKAEEQPRMVALDVSEAIDLPSETLRVVEAPQVAVGSFGGPATGIISSSRQASSVSTAGFGQPTATVASGNGHGVAVSSFGASTGQASRTNGEARVVSAGFNATQPAPVLRAVTTNLASVLTQPVIVSEASPIYTDEAHAARISGTVVLRVRFTAEGSVKVLGVLHGLGYGLDESAIQTAESITFTPAMQNGQAVTFDTTARITFQMP